MNKRARNKERVGIAYQFTDKKIDPDRQKRQTTRKSSQIDKRANGQNVAQPMHKNLAGQIHGIMNHR